MKKILSVLVVLLSLSLAGCFVENSSEEIAELKKEIEMLKQENPEQVEQKVEQKEDFFSKNMACLNLREQAKKELDSWSSQREIEALFYSPKEQECLVLVHSESADYVHKSLYRFSELTSVGHPIEGCIEEGFGACYNFSKDVLEKYKNE